MNTRNYYLALAIIAIIISVVGVSYATYYIHLESVKRTDCFSKIAQEFCINQNSSMNSLIIYFKPQFWCNIPFNRTTGNSMIMYYFSPEETSRCRK